MVVICLLVYNMLLKKIKRNLIIGLKRIKVCYKIKCEYFLVNMWWENDKSMVIDFN